MTQHYDGRITRGHDFKYETPEEMQEKIDEYFDLCVAEERRPLVTGLILHLGYPNHTCFNRQAKRAGFEDVISTAKMRVVAAYEDYLLTGKGTQGAIFAMTNIKTEPPGEDPAWVSKQQTELTGKDGAELLKGLAPADLPFFIDQLKSLLEASGEGS